MLKNRHFTDHKLRIDLDLEQIHLNKRNMFLPVITLSWVYSQHN